MAVDPEVSEYVLCGTKSPAVKQSMTCCYGYITCLSRHQQPAPIQHTISAPPVNLEMPKQVQSKVATN